MRLSLKATGAPHPGGASSQPQTETREPIKLSGNTAALRFITLSSLFPPSMLVKGFAKNVPEF